METKRFTKNDGGFICIHCGKEVAPLGYTSRNHCPFCLWSLHIDINPGDRECDCLGALEPIKVETNAKRGFIVVHKCRKCGSVKRNKAADDDDRDLLIKLTAAEI